MEVANILAKGTKLREYAKGVENNVRQVKLDSIQKKKGMFHHSSFLAGGTTLAAEREYPVVVSCVDILVISARDVIIAVGGPYIPLKIGRRDGRRSRAEILEQYLPDHNESISMVLDMFAAMGRCQMMKRKPAAFSSCSSTGPLFRRT